MRRESKPAPALPKVGECARAGGRGGCGGGGRARQRRASGGARGLGEAPPLHLVQKVNIDKTGEHDDQLEPALQHAALSGATHGRGHRRARGRHGRARRRATQPGRTPCPCCLFGRRLLPGRLVSDPSQHLFSFRCSCYCQRLLGRNCGAKRETASRRRGWRRLPARPHVEVGELRAVAGFWSGEALQTGREGYGLGWGGRAGRPRARRPLISARG
eukprot:scaffold52626_cov61-Phaeocystis_antarctica.AAC.4